VEKTVSRKAEENAKEDDQATCNRHEKAGTGMNSALQIAKMIDG